MIGFNGNSLRARWTLHRHHSFPSIPFVSWYRVDFFLRTDDLQITSGFVSFLSSKQYLWKSETLSFDTLLWYRQFLGTIKWGGFQFGPFENTVVQWIIQTGELDYILSSGPICPYKRILMLKSHTLSIEHTWIPAQTQVRSKKMKAYLNNCPPVVFSVWSPGTVVLKIATDIKIQASYELNSCHVSYLI